MSEAEIHVLRARLEGGIRSKAQRGELKMRLPTGLVYDEQDRVVLDPDRQVQQSFFTFLETFQRTGSACATVRDFRRQGLLMPRRLRRGPKKGVPPLVICRILRHASWDTTRKHYAPGDVQKDTGILREKLANPESEATTATQNVAFVPGYIPEFNLT